MIFYFLIVLLIKCDNSGVDASAVTVTPAPGAVLAGLTPDLTLTCDLHDTAPSAGIIGRRDVTQTSSNMAAVTSVILMKDGVDVATLTQQGQAVHVSLAPNLTNPLVSSSIVKGEAKLSLTLPADPWTAGSWECEVNAVEVTGHTVTFYSSTEVSRVTPTIADLVTYVSSLNAKVNNLTNDNQALKNQNNALQNEIQDVKNKSQAAVFFNAFLVSDTNVTKGQVLKFTRVTDNVGQGYDPSTGEFTCRVPGVYHFTLSCMKAYTGQFYLDLQVNDVTQFELHESGTTNSWDTAADSVTVKLGQGDVVKVVGNTYGAMVVSSVHGAFSNFGGHLVTAL